MLPCAYVQSFTINYVFIIIFVVNVAMHAIIDHMKANWKVINLWHDQILHMIQIVGTFMILLGGK